MASIWKTAAATARTRSGAFAFNGVGRNGEASIDDGNARTGLGALGLDYRGERFRWTLDAISQNEDTKNFRPQMGIQTHSAVHSRCARRAQQLVPRTQC